MLISSMNYKGGQGKSLWSAILAQWADAELLDMDHRQGDAHAWAQAAGRPSRVVSRSFDETLKAAAAAPGWFVADCPPHEGEETLSALRHSHLVVIPVVPSGAQDARAWGRMQDALEAAWRLNPGLKAAVVLNANRQTALAKEFLEVLKAWHAPSKARCVLGVVPQRVALAEAFGAGQVPSDPSITEVLKRLRAFARQ